MEMWERKKSVTETPACTKPETMALTAFANASEKFPKARVISQSTLKSSQMVCEWLEAAPPVAIHEHFIHLIPAQCDVIWDACVFYLSNTETMQCKIVLEVIVL